MTTLDVDVLIPQYGRTDFTARCVTAVRRSTGDVSIAVHVHDNASAGGPGLVASRDDVILTRSTENLGFGRAMNAMAAAASGRYLLLLNNDTIVHPRAVERLVARADALPAAAPVVPLYRDFAGRPLEMGGGLGQGGRAWQLFRHRVLPRGLATTPHHADYGSAAAMLIDRELFLEVGGFDDAYAPAYYEDTDLCLRLAAMGRRTIVEPNAVVLHYEGGTAGTDTASGLKAFQVRNRSIFADRFAATLDALGPVGLHRAIASATEPAVGQPRVLWVSTVLPRGDRDGGGRRTMEMLTGLRASGAGVALWARSPQDPERYGPQLSALGIPWFGAQGPIRWSGAGRPTSTYDDLDELLAAAPWDTVVVWTARFARHVIPRIRDHAPDAAVVVDNGDLHFLRHDRGRELGVEITDTLTKEQELGAYVDADGVITSSQPEDEVLHEEVDGLATHVFTVAPPAPVPLDPAPAGALMFLGNFGHPPNVDAVTYWSEQLAPRVAAGVRHDVPLRLVGAATDGLVDHGAIDVAGWVPELVTEFARTRVFLAPLRYGAGTKGKLVEAMAHGVPVVTTSIGAEGFPRRVVDAMLVADDPDELAEHVVRLLTDDDAWHAQRAAVSAAAAWFHEAAGDAARTLTAWLLARGHAHRHGEPPPRIVTREDPEPERRAWDGDPVEPRPFDPTTLPSTATTTPAPVFVLGAPRSGTSMMAHAVGQHPSLWTGEESDFLAPLGRAAREAWQHGTRRGDLHWLSAAGVSWEEFAAHLGLGINALYTQRADGRRWVEQTPAYTVNVDLMADLFPGARFVHMLRDGRSVAHSLAHFVRPVPHADAAALWARFTRAALDFADSSRGDALLIVRYEDVVNDTAAALERIFSFLGLEPSPEAVAFIAERGPINSSFQGETSAEKAGPRWADWSRTDREVFHAAAGDLLVQLGYEPDAAWVTATRG